MNKRFPREAWHSKDALLLEIFERNPLEGRSNEEDIGRTTSAFSNHLVIHIKNIQSYTPNDKRLKEPTNCALVNISEEVVCVVWANLWRLNGYNKLDRLDFGWKEVKVIRELAEMMIKKDGW